MAKPVPRLSPDDIQRIIATAWDDRPPFDAVLRAHGLTHGQVVALLKRELTPNAYKVWTARTKSAAGPAARSARR
ncbi:MAG: TIGR03643 family protein [Burkholderiaceae bacterium]|nr:TIGR03643 family protein [Burkholderiaceae bacterium]